MIDGAGLVPGRKAVIGDADLSGYEPVCAPSVHLGQLGILGLRVEITGQNHGGVGKGTGALHLFDNLLKSQRAGLRPHVVQMEVDQAEDLFFFQILKDRLGAHPGTDGLLLIAAGGNAGSGREPGGKHHFLSGEKRGIFED